MFSYSLAVGRGSPFPFDQSLVIVERDLPIFPPVLLTYSTEEDDPFFFFFRLRNGNGAEVLMLHCPQGDKYFFFFSYGERDEAFFPPLSVRDFGFFSPAGDSFPVDLSEDLFCSSLEKKISWPLFSLKALLIEGFPLSLRYSSGKWSGVPATKPASRKR